jgi:large subunit ribosomal protein L5
MQFDDKLAPQLGAAEPMKKRPPAPRRRKPSAAPRSGSAVREAKTAASAAAVVPAAPPRVLVRYRSEVRPALIREFEYPSVMAAPSVTKVVLNMGLGEALTNARALEMAPMQLGLIAGQKPVLTKARKSIANFKLREGMAIGAAVTLRGRRMWEFLDRFLSLALPRIRDFRGVSRTAFDGQGNYSVGIREQLIFPEFDYSDIDRIRGFQVTIATSARSDREGFRLLELLGMPFAHEGQGR